VVFNCKINGGAGIQRPRWNSRVGTLGAALRFLRVKRRGCGERGTATSERPGQRRERNAKAALGCARGRSKPSAPTKRTSRATAKNNGGAEIQRPRWGARVGTPGAALRFLRVKRRGCGERGAATSERPGQRRERNAKAALGCARRDAGGGPSIPQDKASREGLARPSPTRNEAESTEMTTAGPNGDGKCGAERWEGLKTKTLPYNGNCLNCRCPLAKLTAGCFARCL
jgi:hypothetical protein